MKNYKGQETVMPTLYLHGGPGLSAAVEREWFKGIPGVDWWDQPSVGSSPRPFARLCDAAVDRLESLARSSRSKVRLLSNSCGALLAHTAACRRPNLVAGVTMLAPCFDVMGAILHAAQNLTHTLPPEAPLKEFMESSGGEIHSMEELAAFATAIVTTPRFSDRYWGADSERARRRFEEISGRVGRIDIETFLTVTWDIHVSAHAAPQNLSIQATALLGKDDPLGREDDEREVLRRFANADVEVCDGGHQLVFELPEIAFLPPSASAWHSSKP